MELVLSIFLFLSVLVSGIALWQNWRILKRRQEDETLTEQEADRFSRWLKVFRIASLIALTATILRLFLPL